MLALESCGSINVRSRSSVLYGQLKVIVVPFVTWRIPSESQKNKLFFCIIKRPIDEKICPRVQFSGNRGKGNFRERLTKRMQPLKKLSEGGVLNFILKVELSYDELAVQIA